METSIKSWLPCFNGFYGSWYESSIDDKEIQEIDYINELRKEKHLIGEVTWDQLDIDYGTMYNELSISIFEIVRDFLKENKLIKDAIFEELKSPQYYNFSNDSINCEFIVDEENIKLIDKFLADNEELFAEYIKNNYTSYDGFNSWHSNEYKDWLGFDNYNHPHKFAAVLQFILNSVIGEDDISDTLYCDTFDDFCVGNHIKNWDDLTEKHYCKECREFDCPEHCVKTPLEFGKDYILITDTDEIKRIFCANGILKEIRPIYTKEDEIWWVDDFNIDSVEYLIRIK